MNILLPLPLKKWVDRQVKEQGYETADAFFRDMVQRERVLESRERIDDLLTEAISEGTAKPMTAADWARIRAKGRTLAAQRRKK